MCADENNNKNKTNLPQPLTLSFLNCKETSKPITLKFLNFPLVFNSCFVQKNSIIA